MSGLKPTWQDQQWYEQQKEQERAQQFAGQTGIVGEALMTLGGFARDVIEDNKDSQWGQFIGSMVQGLGHADYMAKKQAYEMHGPTGPQALGALELADTALSLGGTAVLRNAPKLAKEAVKAGAKDIKNLGVGQATLATLQEGIDRIPPMGPQLQVSLAGVGNLDSFVGPKIQQLQPPTVMKAVTTTDEEILGSVRGGIKPGDSLSSPAQEKQLINRARTIEQKSGFISQINEHLTALKELATDPKNLAIYVKNNPLIDDLYKRKKGDLKGIADSLRARKKDAMESLSQWQSNVLPFEKDGPAQKWFRSTAGQAAKKAEEVARGLSDWLHQHHLFPKGISAAYFSKMDELIAAGKATNDDLIAMAEYAAAQNRRAGDVKSNLLNMEDAPHGELHDVLREQGAELPKEKIQDSLKNVKNVDDLMTLWKEILTGDVAYNIDTAKIWEPLDKTLKEIQNK